MFCQRIAAISLALVIFLVTQGHARPKTDVVVMKNGDVVNCEIKELSMGILTASTDAMGTVEIKWEKVDSLSTDFYYRILTSDGTRYFGTPSLAKGSSDFRVVTADAVVSVDFINVIEIVPLEKSFWSKNDGSLSIGFSYTKASKVAQFTLDWSNRFRTERDLIDIGANSILTDDRDAENISRKITLNGTYYRLLKKRWIGAGGATLERNDELGIKRRLQALAGAGINAIQSNRSHLLALTGLAVNSEVATDSTSSTQSLEAVIALSYAYFKYFSPKRDVTTNLYLYPSLTQSGRFRVEFNIKWSIEIVEDFFFNLSFYESYDNKGPNNEGKKEDYGIVTSVGWSY